MKKNPLIDLKNKRYVLLWLGRFTALAFVAIVFEFATFPSKSTIDDDLTLNLDIEELPPATIEKVKPKPIPKPKKIEVIKIVDDKKEIEEAVIETTDITEDLVLEPIEDIVEVIDEPEEPFIKAEIMPSFPGGDKALLRFLGKEIKYPKMAVNEGISGRVYLEFIVEKDGSISSLNLLRGIGGGCDEEAIRVLNSMPKWNPGKQRNEPVRVKFTLPVNFVLK